MFLSLPSHLSKKINEILKKLLYSVLITWETQYTGPVDGHLGHLPFFIL